MGPDEFQMMVNHNAYTNYMAKRTFEYTLTLIKRYRKHKKCIQALHQTNTDDELLNSFKEASDNMLILFD